MIINRRIVSVFSPLLSAALFLFSFSCPAASSENWPQFRGPGASGLSAKPAPVTWDIETGKNIRWQTPIPGLGHASPIIWNDRIYIATAVKPGEKPKLKVGLYGNVDSYNEKEKHQWRLLSIDKASGRILWDKLALEAVPRSKRHTKASHCNSTPATDGRRIVALFGSEGLFCFDMDGHELWRKELGRLEAGWYTTKDTEWGFGSSPVLHEGRIIVQCDTLSEQYLAVFDAKDGHELWRTARKDVPTWCTPLIAAGAGRTQIVLSGWKQIAGYEFATGKELWHMKEGGDIPVASPILAGDLAIFTSAHGRFHPIRSVRLDGSGDITPASVDDTNKYVLWSQPRSGAYLSTPIAVGNYVWSDLDGIVSCFSTSTGQAQYKERIGGGNEGFTASPVAAHDKLYYTGELGDVFVLPATNAFEVLATNKLGGLCLSTPAVSDGVLFFRTTEKLLAIANKENATGSR